VPVLKAVALVVAKSSSAVAIDSSSFPSFSSGFDINSGAAILLSKSAHSRPAKRITVLELIIVPDISRTTARPSLRSLRLS
jgi:hypothetical protein